MGSAKHDKYTRLGLFIIKLGIKFLDISGRVHSANISAVNESSRLVSVEWFEKGETKGKEVNFIIFLP